MNEREMYYNSYGYTNANPNMMGGFMPNMMMPNMQNNNDFFNDINNRINRLERNVKRLDQRISRLETPYGNNGNTTNIYNEQPDSSLYML